MKLQWHYKYLLVFFLLLNFPFRQAQNGFVKQ